jgi:hypothetical protein
MSNATDPGRKPIPALPAERPKTASPPARLGRTWRTLIALAVASTLTACASGPRPIVASYPTPPLRLAQPCPLPAMEPDSGSPPDLLANHTAWALALHRCRALHSDLIDWLAAVRRPPD